MRTQLKKLDKLGVVARGKSKHRPRNDPKLYNGEYPFIQTADVKNADLYLTEYSQTYNEEGLAQSALWNPGTLCITIAANIADTSILSIPACFPDSIIGFIPYEGISDARFVKYQFDLLQGRCRQISQGTAQDNMSWERLSQIDFYAPEYKKQVHIADYLEQYERLIENNRKQIKLLEEAAQRLYKEWFIDLKFPGHETTPIDPTTNLPEGWVLDNMFSVAKYVRGASYSTENLVNEGEYLMVNLGNIQPYGGYRYSREKEYDGSVKDGSAVNAGCLVMGLTEQAEGLAGYAAVVPTLKKSAFASADLAIVQPFTVTPFYLYCCLRFGGASRAISPLANGAKIKHLKPKSLMRISVTVPSWPLMKKFDLIISGLHQQMDVLQMQIEQAQEARDRLLPKLMSGEIEV